jgi:DNA repair protein RadD
MQPMHSPVVKNVTIQHVDYMKLQIEGKPPMLRVFYVGTEPLHVCTEDVCLEDTGSARTIAECWWSRRTSIPVPETVDEALRHVEALRTPEAIDVAINGRKPEVLEFYGDLKRRNWQTTRGAR